MTLTTANNLLISSLNKELLLAYKSKEEFWKQRSSQLWLTLGDKNTGFFHASTRGRRARNGLTVLENQEGEVVYEKEQILEQISSYFQDIFTSSNPVCDEIVNQAIHCVSENMNEKLVAIHSSLEIKDALFAIHLDKAPGPGGFSTSFFQSNWETVSPAIINEIQKIFRSGSLPSSINATHIRLILKISSPMKVMDYRPIALCNVYYKVISKILSLRHKPVLETVISEN